MPLIEDLVELDKFLSQLVNFQSGFLLFLEDNWCKDSSFYFLRELPDLGLEFSEEECSAGPCWSWDIRVFGLSKL